MLLLDILQLPFFVSQLCPLVFQVFLFYYPEVVELLCCVTTQEHNTIGRGSKWRSREAHRLFLLVGNTGVGLG